MARSKQLFRKYLSSIVGIVLSGSIILSVVFLFGAVNEVSRLNRNAVITRLKMAREDLLNILEAQNIIIAEVKSNSVFQPFIWENRVMNRKEVIERLNILSERIEILHNCTLYFRSFGTVFTDSSEYMPEVYGKYILGERVFEVISSYDSDDPCLIDSLEQSDILYYVIPIRYRNISSAAELLIFEYHKSEAAAYFSKRYQLPEKMHIQINGRDIYGSEIDEACYDTEAVDGITVRFGVDYHSDDILDNESIRFVFRITSILCAVFSCLAAIVAYMNYRPVQKVLRKIQQEEKDSTLNEIEQIDQYIEQLKAQKSNFAEKLEKNMHETHVLYNQVKQEALLNLLNNTLDDKMKQFMVEYGLRVDTPFMKAVYIPWPDESTMQDLTVHIEDISTGTVYCYALRLPNKKALAALLFGFDSDEITMVAESIEAILADEGMNTVVFIGKQVDKLSLISASLADAELQEKSIQGSNSQILSSAQIIPLIQQGKTEKAIAFTKCFLDDLEKDSISEMLKHYHWLDLIYQVSGAIKSLDIPLSDKHIHELVLLHDRDELEQQLDNLIREAAKTTDNVYVESVQRNDQKLMDFISLHAFEYQMCLDYVASTFNISTKQVSRIVKRQTDKNFKELILEIRMKEALRLLRDGKNPAYITSAIGYSSEEYFRKIFRDYFGETITNYVQRTNIKEVYNGQFSEKEE